MTEQLKPCPFCGERPEIKLASHHCIAGMVFRKDQTAFWNGAFCWEELTAAQEREAKLRELIERRVLLLCGANPVNRRPCIEHDNQLLFLCPVCTAVQDIRSILIEAPKDGKK